MRGRRPSGPEYVDHLAGSEQAKERLKVVLETLTGSCRVLEACQRLGISEARFYELRLEVLEAALDRLEPRPAGRPKRNDAVSQEQMRLLEKQLAQREVDLRASQARTEIALALPQTSAMRTSATRTSATQSEKKTPGPSNQRRQPRQPKATPTPSQPSNSTTANGST